MTARRFAPSPIAFSAVTAIATRIVVVSLGGTLLGSMAGCRTAEPRPIDVADRLFVRGDNEAAAMAYEDVAEDARDSNDELRARFFALAARREAATPEQLDDVLAALRAFAAEASSSQWGRIAAVLARDVEASEALRRAVMRAGVDLAAVEDARTAATAALQRANNRIRELEAELATTRDDRGAAQKHARELEDKLAEERERITALEAELDALKRIDMERVP